MDSNKVYLTQTDTTVGFLSNDSLKLSKIKKRDSEQKILRAVQDFKILQNYTRVPGKFKKKVRNSQKTTFIYPNGDSFRVVAKDDVHQNFLKKFHILYSTSANITQKEFDEDFAVQNSDIVILTKQGFQNTGSSKIYKINNQVIKKIR